jgi:hypothetical protein
MWIGDCAFAVFLWSRKWTNEQFIADIQNQPKFVPDHCLCGAEEDMGKAFGGHSADCPARMPF